MADKVNEIIRVLQNVRAQNMLPTGIALSARDYDELFPPGNGSKVYLHGVEVIRDEKLSPGAVLVAMIPWTEKRKRRR